MDQASLVTVTCGAIEWRLQQEGADEVRQHAIERIAELDAVPGAERIKQSLSRTVWRVPLASGRELIVKEYRSRSWRDRLKKLVQGSKPAIEWAASRRLLAMGLPVSRAIAVGLPARSGAEVDGYLIIEAERDALGMSDYLDTLGPASDPAALDRRLGVVCDLARGVRRLHDAGVRHDDLHAGNVLVRVNAESPGDRFVVLDLHRIRIERPAGLRHRAAAIAKLLKDYPACQPLEPQLPEVFLRAYCEAEPPLRGRLLEPDAIERRIARQAAVRLRSRAKRCLMNSSKFAVERFDEGRVWRLREYPLSELLALVEQHDEARAARPAAAARQPFVSEHARAEHGGATVQVTSFPAQGGLGGLFQALVPSPAVDAYAAAHRRSLEQGGGPRVVAAVEWVRGERRGSSVAMIEGARALRL